MYLSFNPLNAEVNPICHLLALLGAHHILHISKKRVNINFQLNLKVNNSLTYVFMTHILYFDVKKATLKFVQAF